MGLDITVFGPGELKLQRDSFKTTDEYYEALEAQDLENVFVNPDFVQRADGMVSGGYEAPRLMDFRAGSYSGHYQFRNSLTVYLAKEADFPTYLSKLPEEPINSLETSPPFFELIDMSDCEGVLGPKTCAKLAKDFEEHEVEFMTSPSAEDWYLRWPSPSARDKDLYKAWKDGLKLAADNGGFLTFH